MTLAFFVVGAVACGMVAGWSFGHGDPVWGVVSAICSIIACAVAWREMGEA